jgi:hypothetical protein
MEHEVKHALEVYKTAKSKDLPFWKKLQEITVEIVIIVFAVSLSIWLHDRSEHKRQQAEVRQFMLGLQQDLKDDIAEMQGDKKTYIMVGSAFRYISKPLASFQLNADSINKDFPYIFNTTGMVPHNGRYEGFKSSGKLGNIEDSRLQNDITDLYQKQIPSILATTDSYTERKSLLFAYLYKKEKFPNGIHNLIQALSTDEAKNLCTSLSYTYQIVSRYDAAIASAQKVVSEINVNYNKN